MSNERAPLHNKRIVLTRSRAQSAASITQLTTLGATVIPFPTIAFLPLPDGLTQLKQCDLTAYDWIILTSQNAVTFCEQEGCLARVRQLQSMGKMGNAPSIAVSGEKTAAALRTAQIEPTVIPNAFVGEALVEALGDVRGCAILLPRAKMGRPEIVTYLCERGAIVDEIHLYETVCATPDEGAFIELAQGADVILFTSPTTVHYYCQLIAERGITPSISQIACIGPVTARAAEAHQLPVHIMPETHTMDQLIAEIISKNEQDNEI